MPAVPASIPTSLKLPSALKLQLEEDAKQMGMSLHAFMVSTLADAAQRKRLRQTFAQDSTDALGVMKATGTGHAIEDVQIFFLTQRTSSGEKRASCTLATEKNGLRCEHRISKPGGIPRFAAPRSFFVRVRRPIGSRTARFHHRCLAGVDASTRDWPPGGRWFAGTDHLSPTQRLSGALRMG